MITLQQVSKRYDEVVALQPIDLTFAAGEVVALIGPSGCGKSTLLRVILGLIEPTSGEVRLDGEAVNSGTVLRVRRKVGYVVQDGGLFPHLTARGNVELMAQHLGRKVDLDRLTELTRFPKDGLDRFPAELSGGQRQRVGLMRALALDPSILLMDEPLGALDPLVRVALQRDLKELFTTLRKTVILVTHDLAEAAYLADRIVLMDTGRVVQVGTLEDLIERPASPFVTRFLEAQRAPVAL
ncbi:MAG: ATP-binding cassette domain-containing protein [Fimbriimonas sp.]